ncbi:MepB family protein [Rhodococcus sp. IEGM 1381]|uniref:MepB family protein n=1 Tax=Rhodococcus sp. IEGM 1381 TaxID=3047085 RepID=UPI0024B711E2|nr:MepB family protein [Rhodococcus sp. IEGM 1381]MDI9896769.1 MepB family protein [Rhodococcus sp. IEGM 1381]
MDPVDTSTVGRCDETNAEYCGLVAQLHGERWRVRTARVTPRKPGLFLAFWRRGADGTTEPFRSTDQDGLLVLIDTDGHRAGFRFTAEQLDRLGITASPAHLGKRGFRVYPTWCTGLNPQARRTQQQHAEAFFEV